MNYEIVKKSFYLTSLFADIKSEHNWTTHETKLTLLLFAQLDKYKIYLPDFNNFENDIDAYLNQVRQIPQEYTFTKEQFKEVTGTDSSHLSRDIKKAIKGLLSKIIIMPHPLAPNDKESLEGITWFNKINYLNTTGIIKIKLNRDAIERLVAFVKYSNISFENIVNLQNQNSIFTYLTLKILRDASRYKELELTIEEFKDRIGCSNKYKLTKDFRVYVLDIVKREINKFTDLDFDFQLKKVGKAYKYIKMNFDYKPEYLEQKVKSKYKQQKIGQMVKNVKDDDYDSPFEHILTGWNIRARKVVELEDTYSLEVIQQAIDLTLEKEKAGEIKTTKAAIFLGILENKQSAFDEQFERDKIKNKQQQEKQLREQVSAEYNTLSSFILSNQDLIQSVLTSNTKHLPITDENAIPVFKKLKSIDADKFRGYTVPILSFYHFESNSNVSDTLSDIVDRSQYIEIKTYKDDMGIVQAYKESLDKIKENEYITDEQKEILRKEVQETINLLLGL